MTTSLPWKRGLESSTSCQPSGNKERIANVERFENYFLISKSLYDSATDFVQAACNKGYGHGTGISAPTEPITTYKIVIIKSEFHGKVKVTKRKWRNPLHQSQHSRILLIQSKLSNTAQLRSPQVRTVYANSIPFNRPDISLTWWHGRGGSGL